MDKTQVTQTTVTKMKTSLRRNLIPEANRLLGLNLAEANRVELREDLERVKDQLQERMSRIREGFREWMDQINEYDDADQRQEKEDAFHRFRLEGTVACPEDIEDLLEEVRDLILNVGRKISRIMNPVMVPPLPIHPPNPIPLAGVPPIPALIAAQNDPVDQNGLAQDNLNEEVLALNQPPFVPVAFPQAPIIQNPNLDIEPSINLKVDLRRFDGNDPAEYSRFMASFQYHVGRRNASDSVKFDHLERQLDPPARNAIAGLELADESYQLALDILNKRYGQKPLIVERLNQRLMKLSLNNMQANELRRFLDELNKILAQLKTATGEINQNGTICSVIMSKFPSHVFMKLEEMKGSYDPWTVELLCDKFSLFVNQRESVADHTESKRSESEKYGKRKPGQPFDENGENTSPKGQEGQKKQNQPLFGGQSGTPSGQRRICNFCGEGHAPGSCLKYKTVDQRKSRILELRKCEKCLRSDHETKDCMVSGRCFVCRDPSHNGLFCPEKGRAESTTGMSVVNYPGTSQKAKYPTETGLNNRRKKVMLLTAVAEVRNPNNVNGITTRARIFLDSGNERTYITTSLARKLGLKTQFEEALKVQLFLNKTKRVNSSVVNLTMQLKDGSQLPIEANIVDQISGLITRFELGLDDKRAIKKDHAQYLADSYWEKPGFVPDILIGEDYFWNIVKGEKEELPSGLKLIPSTLGLLIGGLARSDSSQKEITVVQAQFSKVVISSQGTEPKSEEGILTVEAERKQDQGQPSVAEVLSSMESLETIGIKDSPYVNDDEIAMALFQKGFRRTENGRCQVELPFKENAEMLPDNYGLAKGRAKSLGRRFQLDPKIQRRYTEVIAQQLELEIIEEATDAQKETDVHYLPHHPVVREDKTTTKVRPVYDGSAKARASDLSINEVLYKCPDLLPKLVGILIRFRSMPIPMVADVEKAFLQVGIAPKHRDYLRFMYFRDPEKPPTDDNFIIYRFTRVPFGLICSPFLLEGSIAEHLKKNGSNLALQVQQNIYVDNVLIGADNSEEAIQKRILCKELFEDIQMNLRAWTSNDETFNGQLPEEDGVKEGPYKLLGVGWDRKLDTIFLSKMTKPEKFTRRTLVGSIASLYDPLGLSLPVAFKGKVFLQKVLKSSKGSWDQSLPDELVKEWETVFSDMNLVAEVAIKRPILVADGSKAELFVFCDASIKAYGAAVFLRISTEQKIESRLIFSRLRLVPGGKRGFRVTLPRLELLAVYIGAQIVQMLRQELNFKIKRIIIWTDSECVLHWVNSSKPLSVFVENRLKVIRECTGVEFRFVPTKENPADRLTRGTSVNEWRDDALWWSGPRWIVQPESEWPKTHIDSASPNTEEERSVREISAVAAIGMNATCESGIPELLPVKFNDWTRLRRVTVLVIRTLKRMIFNNSKPMDLLKVKDNNLWEAVSKINCEGKWFISAADLLVAEKFWFYRIQHSAFESVFKSLGTKTEDSLVKQLDLVQNESGLLESRGRQEILDKPSPLLLPKNHQITKLIIDDIHKENLHMRVGHTLAQVRQRFWIPHGRVVVKNVLNSCITCKKFHGGPFRLPDMPTLPRSRVCQSEPFQFVGLDYCGPMMVRKSRKEEPEKRWICIFTCLAIRAVHLEVVKDLSTESFLHTVQRFISRRGTPEKIISDNFSSFKMGQQVLDAMWQDTIDDAEVYSYFSKKGMNWNFITELSPWEGGFYERLIGSVKSCLRKALGRKIPILEDFITLVTKVEGILNSRPLTHSGEDISDLDRLITPANFLVGRKKLGLPAFGTGTNLEDPDFSLGESPAETVYRMFQNREKTLDSFWEIWHQDYLDLLRSRSQRDHRHPRILAKTSPWVGEVVLVHDANVPRSCWRLGQIVSLRRAGKDGMDVKSAEVRVPNGRIIRRPINLLFPLEIPCSASDQQTPANPEEEILTVPKSEKVQMDRPKRIAAITCRKKIEDLSKDQALSGFISVPRECPGSSRRRNKNDEFAI